MKMTIPLYVESWRRPGEKGTTYAVRPLFFAVPLRRDHHLGRATAKCVADLKSELTHLGRAGRHEELARYTFSPVAEPARQKVSIELRTGYVQQAFFVVSFRALRRRVAFLPSLPEIWFEVPRGRSLADRTQEVLTDFFRRRERDGDDARQLIARTGLRGKAWVTTADFDVETRQQVRTCKTQLMAAIAAGDVVDGASELQKTGRCLDVLYPDDLSRSVHCDEAVSELERLLSAADRRPVLIVGPRLVGKTTLVHEYVYRKVERQRSQFRSRRNVWLLSPQRLISGMSFVGQWENRLLAILKHARRKDHVLYFDDLVGLFRAGVSRDSDLCVADVLKPYLERREIRLLGEITPAAFRVLRELDRGFADQFHVVRLAEPDRGTALRILIAAVRLLEHQYRCRFSIDVLPMVIDLCRRFARETAFPGNAAAILQQLAARHPDDEVTRKTALADFQSRSGLRLAFVDGMQRLRRDEIVAGIEQMMVGQQPAVSSAADAISIAKARLNDPGRPLGSFLFLGPTGVGKTQCAKAIANFLYGSPGRLVRFDMNEFTSSPAAARLVGTLGSPEGLLTSALRRQPFSVLLLDEIEKAHPDVFDLLLQVLGEGRLTDALGRTADFTNAIIVLTSNLGSREASAALGFGREEAPRDHVYLHVAENFFRPEFINRLDRIVVFDSLSEGEVRRIARRNIEELSRREGLIRRRCVLRADEGVLDRVIRAGFEPRWGARGVRRMIERELLQPVAVELARAATPAPTVVSLYEAVGDIRVQVESLADAERVRGTTADFAWPALRDALPKLRSSLERLRCEYERHRPAGPIVASAIRPEQYHYLNLMEFLGAAQSRCDLLQEQLAAEVHDRLGRGQRGLAGTRVSHARRRRVAIWRNPDATPDRRVLVELMSAEDIHEYLRDVNERSAAWDSDSEQTALLRDLALLEALRPTDEGWRDERVLLLVRGLQSAPLLRWKLLELFASSFRFTAGSEAEIEIGLECRVHRTDAAGTGESGISRETLARLEGLRCRPVTCEGTGAARLLSREVGTHLFVQKDGSLQPFQVVSLPISPEENIDTVLGVRLDEHVRWRERRRAGAVGEPDPLFALRPVVRVYDERGITLDLRSGLSLETAAGIPSTLNPLVTAALPLPEELTTP